MISLQIAAAVLAVSGVGDTVLLDFGAGYCEPCRRMEPVVNQLASAGYPIRKIDIVREPHLAEKYGVEAIPTFIMLKDGQVVDRVTSIVSQQRLLEMFEKAKKPAEPAPQRNTQPVGGSSPGQPFPATPVDQPWDAGASLNSANTSKSPSTQSPSSPQYLLQATVRIRVVDSTGSSVATGTIIDARAGEVLVLSCSHAFREYAKVGGQILVDMFGEGAPKRLSAEFIGLDEKSDVSLISIRTDWQPTVARVAPREYKPRTGDAVVSIGCDHGADPTVRASRIASIDKYGGPPNIQVEGQPVQGRSGGGLFSSEGLVIGVCNAADPQDNEGLFAAIGSIHAELDRNALTWVYRTPVPGDATPNPVEITSTRDASREIPLAAISSAMATVPLAESRGLGSTTSPATTGTMTTQEMQMLAELQAKAASAEVVIVIRPLNDPKAKSEVFVLPQASPGFRQHLLSAAHAQ